MGCAEQCAGCGGRSRVVYFLVAGRQVDRKVDSDILNATEGLVTRLSRKNAEVH